MANWFEKLSPAAQKAYIAKHPNSVYAKGAGKRAKKPDGDKAASVAQKKITKLRGDLRKLESGLKYLKSKENHKRLSDETKASIKKQIRVKESRIRQHKNVIQDLLNSAAHSRAKASAARRGKQM